MRPWPPVDVTPCAICDQLTPDLHLEPWDTGDGVLLVCMLCRVDLDAAWEQLSEGSPGAPA